MPELNLKYVAVTENVTIVIFKKFSIKNVCLSVLLVVIMKNPVGRVDNLQTAFVVVKYSAFRDNNNHLNRHYLFQVSYRHYQIV